MRQKALEEQHVRQAADRRAVEDERSAIAEERAALGEDRLRTSRAAEAVRAMQLRLSGHLSGGGAGGAPPSLSLSDTELRGLEGLLGGDTFGRAGAEAGAGGGSGLEAGSGGTVDMLWKVLREVRADSARLSRGGQQQGVISGSDGETRSKLTSSLKRSSNTYSAGTAAQMEYLATLRGASTPQRAGAGAKPGGGPGGGSGVSWQEGAAQQQSRVTGGGGGAAHRHSNVSNASSAQFTNLTSVSASGEVNGSGTSENESSDPGEPVL